MILFDNGRVGWQCWRCGRPIMGACWLWTGDYKTWVLVDIAKMGDDDETINLKPFGVRCFQRMVESGVVDTSKRR